MKLIYNLVIILFVVFLYKEPLKAETYFLDFKFILDESIAGKKANKYLKDQLQEGIKKLKDKEKQLQKEEKEIIQQKKILSAEEYKKKISSLRTKVSTLKKDRNNILDSISKKQKKARNIILGELNPIVKGYMSENKIRIVLDKKSILLGDESLDITKNIMNLLNKKLKKIDLN